VRSDWVNLGRGGVSILSGGFRRKPRGMSYLVDGEGERERGQERKESKEGGEKGRTNERVDGNEES